MKILIALLCLYCGITNAQVYKCVGDNGKITYSDIKCGSASTGPSNTQKSNSSIRHDKNYLLQQAATIYPLFTSIHEEVDQYFYQIVFFMYLLMSGICYSAYRKDKKHAKTQQWRVPERTLHFYELFGGWPGGLIAQHILRHKNKKLSYQVTFWMIVMLHVVVWYYYLILNQSLAHQIILFISPTA